MQKDINFLSGKLDRTFTVTDELIFKVCKIEFLITLLKPSLTVKAV